MSKKSENDNVIGSNKRLDCTISLKNVSKRYDTKSKVVIDALNNVNLTFDKNGLTVILGASGCGKTTLLNILGGLDAPNEGEVVINNTVVGKDVTYEEYRKDYVGFVFQEYNLLADLNVFDNVSLAVSYKDKAQRKTAVNEVLCAVGLSGYENRHISELSGGQKQRVAIARALAQNCNVLLCDEPTGNLDSQNGEEIFDLLKQVAKEKLVVVVSHNEEFAQKYAQRIVRIKDGKVVADEQKENATATLQSDVKQHSGNKVSFGYKLKCGFNNLFVQKFKTAISFLLLFLSLFTSCVMQIALGYNSQLTIAKATEFDDTVVLIANGNSSEKDGVSNHYEQQKLNDDTSILANSLFAKGYKQNCCTYFAINEDNADILQCKEYYFCNSQLADGYAYVSDFFVDVVLRDNANYLQINFENYSQLLDKEVVYKDNVLYKIGGGFATDYKDYLTDNIGSLTTLQYYETYLCGQNAEVATKYKYDYCAVYVNVQTLNNMYLEDNSLGFDSQNGETVSFAIGSTTKTLGQIDLQKIDCTDNLAFYVPSGKIGVVNAEAQYAFSELTDLQQDEIIVNGELYDFIFGTHTNWENFYNSYNIALDQGEPLANSLPHLGEIISLTVQSNGQTVYKIHNKKIVGVEMNFKFYEPDEKVFYKICGTEEALQITDCIWEQNHYVSQVNWEKIENKLDTLESLRAKNILVAGSIASESYNMESVVHQMSYFFIAVAVIIGCIALISVLNLVSAKIKDKKKEIGILSAIGLKRHEINFIYMVAIICMMLLAALLCIGATYLTTNLLNVLFCKEYLTVVPYFNVTGWTYCVIGSVGVVLFAVSLLPLLQLTRQKPVNIIRENE